MIYELWDMESRNLVGDYPSQDAALTVVRRAFESHGRDVARRLVLSVEDQAGETSPIANGDDLIQLALKGRSAVRPAL